MKIEIKLYNNIYIIIYYLIHFLILIFFLPRFRRPKRAQNGCLIVTIVTTVKKRLKTLSFSTLFLTENAQKSGKEPHFGCGIVTTAGRD